MDAILQVDNNEKSDPSVSPPPGAWPEQMQNLLSRITRWSEVVGIMWAHQVASSQAAIPADKCVQANELKYIFKHFVATDDTAGVIDAVAQEAGVSKS